MTCGAGRGGERPLAVEGQPMEHLQNIAYDLPLLGRGVAVWVRNVVQGLLEHPHEVPQGPRGGEEVWKQFVMPALDPGNGLGTWRGGG